jgi:cysteine synthase
VELPSGTPLNPFPREDKVRIFAKVMGAELPGHTFKLIPVFEWFRRHREKGNIDPGAVVEINSSGGAAIAAVLIGNALGVKVRVSIPDDTPTDKQKIIDYAGGELSLTKDRPGQPTTVEKLRWMKNRPGHFVFDQYGDRANPAGHMKVTMPQIWGQLNSLGAFPGAIVAAKGTTGTVIGARDFAKLHTKKSRRTLIVGVECGDDEPIPAVRSKKRLVPSQILFDHERGICRVVVARYESYQLTIQLLRHGLKLGLSTGAALCGAIKAVAKIIRDAQASQGSRDSKGYFNVVVISGDIIDPYLDQLRVILDSHDL